MLEVEASNNACVAPYASDLRFLLNAGMTKNIKELMAFHKQVMPERKIKLGPGNYIENIQVIDGPLLQFATMIELARFAGIPFPPSEEIVMRTVIAGRRAVRFSSSIVRNMKSVLRLSESNDNPEWGDDECCGIKYKVFLGGPDE